MKCSALVATYYRHSNLGIIAQQEGRISEVPCHFDRALRAARESGDDDLADRAFCNWVAARILVGECVGLTGDLRKILLRSRDDSNRRFAAYHIALICELEHEPERGLFYARLAQSYTARMDGPRACWIASDHNQIGNFLVIDSRFEEALAEYTEALKFSPSHGRSRAVARQNAAFALLMLGRPGEALPLLRASLRNYRRIKAVDLMALNHLDLAQAFLELGKARRAIRHAEIGLVLAQSRAAEPQVKNALFLLGESWHMHGDDGKARIFFDQLARYYDGLPFLADLLLAVDVRRMINLGI